MIMLSDSRIRLRAPEPSDLDAFFLWENDTTAWESGSTIAPLSRHMLAEYIGNYSGDIVAERQLRLVVEEIASGSAVGAVDLFDFDALNNRCGIGIIIDPARRREGFGRDALMLTADYGRRRLGLHQLWCHVAQDNNASRRLFATAGYTPSGRLRSWLRRRNAYVDVYVMQLLLP